MFDLTASGSISLTFEPDDSASLDHHSSSAPLAPARRAGCDATRCCGSRASRGRLARLRGAILQDPDAFIASRLDPALARLADEADVFR